MYKISVIGEKSEIEKNKSALKLSEFQLQFTDKANLQKITTNTSEDLALVVFPWKGFKEIFENPNFKKYIDQKSVVVVGPAIYFFEVEDWVIEGSVNFLSNPVNSMQIESVINEILRIKGAAYQGELASASA